MSFAGVAGPARGVHPFGAVAGGVEVEGDEDDVGGALGCADGVGAADAFFEGDVFGFGDEGRENFVIYVLLRIQVCNKKNFARILLLIHNVYLCINYL